MVTGLVNWDTVRQTCARTAQKGFHFVLACQQMCLGRILGAGGFDDFPFSILGTTMTSQQLMIAV